MTNTKILTFNIQPYYIVNIFPDGNVKINSFSKHKKGKELHTHMNQSGYLCTKLKNKIFFIHQIVATQFLGERPQNLTTNHIDGNKYNNHPSNLEYITIGENIQHAISKKLHISSDPKRNGRYKDGRTVGRTKEYKREWYLINRNRILQKRKQKNAE